MAFKLDEGGGHRRVSPTLSEINIIPLVDVVLVLLLIFMLTAPMMYRGIDVNLPRAASRPTAVEERMVLTVTRDQALYLNERRLTPAGLEGALRDAAVLVSLAGAAVIIGYKGNVYAASRGVPFWNSPVLPILYAAYALRGGAALLLLALPLARVRVDLHEVGLIELWIAVSAATMLGFYLAVMRHTNLASRRAVDELLGGRAALAFYLGTVGAGLVIPIVIGLAGLVGTLSTAALAFVGALSLVGDFFAKYAIARAGVYAPILPPGHKRHNGAASSCQGASPLIGRSAETRRRCCAPRAAGHPRPRRPCGRTRPNKRALRPWSMDSESAAKDSPDQPARRCRPGAALPPDDLPRVGRLMSPVADRGA